MQALLTIIGSLALLALGCGDRKSTGRGNSSSDPGAVDQGALDTWSERACACTTHECERELEKEYKVFEQVGQNIVEWPKLKPGRECLLNRTRATLDVLEAAQKAESKKLKELQKELPSDRELEQMQSEINALRETMDARKAKGAERKGNAASSRR